MPRAMTRYVFEKIRVRASKNQPCPVCGKNRRVAKTFWKTQNPFNVNANGDMKSRTEIQLELGAEARAWVLIPEPHPHCAREKASA